MNALVYPICQWFYIGIGDCVFSTGGMLKHNVCYACAWGALEKNANCKLEIEYMRM